VPLGGRHLVAGLRVASQWRELVTVRHRDAKLLGKTTGLKLMVGMLVSFCLRENTSAQVAALSPLHTKTHTGQGGRVKSAKSAADY